MLFLCFLILKYSSSLLQYLNLTFCCSLDRKVLDIIRQQEQAKDIHEQFHHQVTKNSGFVVESFRFISMSSHRRLMSLQVNANPMVKWCLEHFLNKPFPSSKKSHFQHKASCKTSFICMRIKKSHFHINGYALNFALKQRLGLTQKRRIVWPIKTIVENSVHQSELEANLSCTGAQRGKAHATKSRLFLVLTFDRSRGFNQSRVLRQLLFISDLKGRRIFFLGGRVM